MKMLIYCTKSEPYLTQDKGGICHPSCCISDGILDWHLNGKIVAECDFEVEEIECRISVGINGIHDEYTTKSLGEKELLYASKIDEITFINYLKGKNGYAIHIKNLHIFDKPRELSNYHIPYGCINISCVEKTKGKYLGCSLVRHCKMTQIKKAPQNMMKVESKIDDKDYVLISIRPEWVCKILNGEKTIECRKRVLKEMMQDG